MPTIDVIIADDEAVVRTALERLIGSEPSYRVVGTACDAPEAVDLAERLQPQIAIVDVRMPGGGGPTATAGIRVVSPSTEIVALSAYSDKETVLQMIAAGARGYLVKGCSGSELLDTIARCARGEAAISAEITADVVGELSDQLRRNVYEEELRRARISQVRGVLDEELLEIVFQPIVCLPTGETIGFEALSRLPDGRSPAAWFADAHEVGLGTELELYAADAAVSRLDEVPAWAFLTINLSPEALLLRPWRTYPDAAGRRIVLEITEHARIVDYAELGDALRDARAAGLRIAVDDTGSGFASLQHILQLRPEFIKLDASLTNGIVDNRGHRALAHALIAFSAELGATLIAEGIETGAQLRQLTDLGIAVGQGFYLGRPAPDAEAYARTGDDLPLRRRPGADDPAHPHPVPG